MKKFLLLLFALLVIGGGKSWAITVTTKTPILLTGWVDGCNPTPDYYFIEMQGWQSFVAYENAAGIDLNALEDADAASIQFDMVEAVNNGSVRITFTFFNPDDETTSTQQEWWCLGIGTSADDTSISYGHAFDNSTYWLKKGLSNWEQRKTQKITKVTIDNFNPEIEGVSQLVTYKVRGGTICGQSMTIKQQNAQAFGYYGGTFSPTVAQKNIFKMTDFEVGDYQKIVIKFGEATPEGWAIVTASGYPPSLPTGVTEYEIPLNGENLSEFSIFNWNADSAPIDIEEVYFYKEEALPVTLDFNAVGYATSLKEDLVAAGGLSYNPSTGVLTSDGESTAGTLTLEFTTPVNLNDLNKFNVVRSGTDNIVNRLRFYDADGNLINTWNFNKWSNTLNSDATTAFVNHNPVKKLVWELDAESNTSAMTLTITEIQWQLKLLTAVKAGEVVLNTLPWLEVSDRTAETPNWNMNTSTDTFYGNYSGDPDHYVDLTAYDELRVYRDDNTQFRAFFINAGGSGTNQVNGGTWNADGKYWSINLSTVEKWNDGETARVALKCIKSGGSGQNNIVNNIVVYKTPEIAADYVLSGTGMKTASVTAVLSNPNVTLVDATAVTGTGVDLTPTAEGNPNSLFIASSASVLANTENVVVKDGDDYSSSNIVLTDGSLFRAPFNITATASSYSRDAVGGYGTAVLPFDLDVATCGANIYEITGSDATNVNITRKYSGTIDANTPFLYYKPSGDVNFSGTNIVATVSGYNIQAIGSTGWSIAQSMETTDIANVTTDDFLKDYDVYGISGDSFVKATGALHLKPFRAFFLKAKGTGPNPSEAKSRYAIQIVDDATAVNGISSQGKASEAGRYNAAGQRIAAPQKGLNIIKMSDGQVKKVYIK